MNTPTHHAALQTRSLFISAGHSDADPGAHGNGLNEADIVLAFRDRLADYLGNRITVMRDGNPGQNLTLTAAVKKAAAHDIAVEFHCNAFSDPAATGVETLSAPASVALGERMCAAVSDCLGISSRGAKSESSGQHSRLAFVSDGGGIIVELFFITNPDDVQRYMSHLDECVEAIGQTLINAVCKKPEVACNTGS